jgi:hypothetical protein
MRNICISLENSVNLRKVFSVCQAATSFQVCRRFCKKLYIRTLLLGKYLIFRDGLHIAKQIAHTYTWRFIIDSYSTCVMVCFHMHAHLQCKDSRVDTYSRPCTYSYSPFHEAKFCGVPSCVFDKLGSTAGE